MATRMMGRYYSVTVKNGEGLAESREEWREIEKIREERRREEGEEGERERERERE